MSRWILMNLAFTLYIGYASESSGNSSIQFDPKRSSLTEAGASNVRCTTNLLCS
ncbi:hypothetical protein RSAG8_02377, partial [Rhizoctonia solani AG-8 WAC10335]